MLGDSAFSLGSKRYLNENEVAELLGISEVDVRLRVRQGILRPVGLGATEGKDLWCRDNLNFEREEVLKQYKNFILAERDVRDEVCFLLVLVRRLVGDMEKVKEFIISPEYVGLRFIAERLGVHRVTLQNRIISDGSKGYIRLRGIDKSLPCVKIEGAWRVRLSDLKHVEKIFMKKS